MIMYQQNDGAKLESRFLTSKMHTLCTMLFQLWTWGIMLFQLWTRGTTPESLGDAKWSGRSPWPGQRDHKLTGERGWIHIAITKAKRSIWREINSDGLEWPEKQHERAKSVHKDKTDLEIRDKVEAEKEECPYIHLSIYKVSGLHDMRKHTWYLPVGERIISHLVPRHQGTRTWSASPRTECRGPQGCSESEASTLCLYRLLKLSPFPPTRAECLLMGPTLASLNSTHVTSISG